MLLKLLFRLSRRARLPRFPQRPPQGRPSKTHTSPPAFDAQSSEPCPPSFVKGRAWVIDGDTIVIDKTQIRLFGVDAPELNHRYGKAAKWALVSLCKGKMLRAEVTNIDVHGRTVAKCYLPDGRDILAEMVRLGLAIDWPKYSGGEYTELEILGVRKKLWLADARQKGRMHVWQNFEAQQAKRLATSR